MKIKFDSKTIEISKTFADKASRFGSMEYHELRSAMHDLPDFTVAIRATPKRRRSYMVGLTYEYMESYIAMVDSEGTLLEEFRCVRQACGYAMAKNWFLSKFPDLNNFAA